MSKLLRANFARLWKSKIFWIGIVYSLGVGFFSSVTPYRESLMYTDYNPGFDEFLYTNCMFMPIVAAVFIGLFIGTEYSNGTIRNKIIVGHMRSSVYLANLIVSATAVLIMHIVCIVTVIVLGGTLLRNREMSVGYSVTLGLLSVLTLIAAAAFLLLICMLINSRSNASVAVILISFAFLMGAMMISSRLEAPEYYDAYTVEYYDGETGEMIEEYIEQEKNPKYITGIKREIYEFLYDFLPGCQMVQIGQQEEDIPEKSVQFIIYSLVIAGLSTVGGVFFFRRKNLN
ncbi:MAG: ABC transporter permease [Clostridiales bacterium]|nr:ABC transporter permease [Clostridiales bacterium]